MQYTTPQIDDSTDLNGELGGNKVPMFSRKRGGRRGGRGGRGNN